MPPKKRAKIDPHVNEESSEEHSDNASKSKRGRKKTTTKDNKTPKASLNQTSTEFHNQDFNNTSTTTDGKNWNLKIASWNVDGLRAWIKVLSPH